MCLTDLSESIDQLDLWVHVFHQIKDICGHQFFKCPFSPFPSLWPSFQEPPRHTRWFLSGASPGPWVLFTFLHSLFFLHLWTLRCSLSQASFAGWIFCSLKLVVEPLGEVPTLITVFCPSILSQTVISKTALPVDLFTEVFDPQLVVGQSFDRDFLESQEFRKQTKTERRRQRPRDRDRERETETDILKNHQRHSHFC